MNLKRARQSLRQMIILWALVFDLRVEHPGQFIRTFMVKAKNVYVLWFDESVHLSLLSRLSILLSFLLDGIHLSLMTWWRTLLIRLYKSSISRWVIFTKKRPLAQYAYSLYLNTSTKFNTKSQEYSSIF